MLYCKQCGNKINEEAKFCCKCGSQISEQNLTRPQLHISQRKKTGIVLTVMAVLIIAILVFAIKGGENKNSSLNSQDPTNLLKTKSTAVSPDTGKPKNGTDIETKKNYVGNSKVSYEKKDGVNYYTSSDKKWTVAERSFSALVNGKQIEDHAAFTSVMYDKPAWRAEMKLASNVFLYLCMIPNVEQGNTYSLGDVGSIRAGDPIMIYIDEKNILKGSDGSVMGYYELASTILHGNESQLFKAFDKCELRIDCYDKSKGLVCGFITCSGPTYEGDTITFDGYFALNVPDQSSVSGNSTNVNSGLPQTSYDFNTGTNIQITERKTPCIACHGSKMCQVCHGTGHFSMYGNPPSICSACNGTGICSTCNGTGYN